MIEYKDQVTYKTADGLYTNKKVYIYNAVMDNVNNIIVYYMTSFGYKGHVYLYSPGSGFIIDGIGFTNGVHRRIGADDLNSIKINLYNHQMSLALENIE